MKVVACLGTLLWRVQSSFSLFLLSKLRYNPTLQMSASPLYITLGPPCAGKTTFLKRLGDGNVMDISIDDQPNVYVKIELQHFIHGVNEEDSRKELFGKSLKERIGEQTELSLVLQRLSGILTKEDFVQTLRKEAMSRGPESASTQAEDLLIKAVEKYASGEPDVVLPKEIDLFVFENLFRSNDGAVGGIDSAIHAIRSCPPDQPVAWGNTNTKARDYAEVLSIAQRQGRPVHFIVYGDLDSLQNSDGVLPSDTFKLCGNLDELIHRSISRLITTGRYVPAFRMLEMQERCLDLVRLVVRQWRQKNPNSTKVDKFELERGLAQLNGWDLNRNRTVFRIPQHKLPRGSGRRPMPGRGRVSVQRRHYDSHVPYGRGYRGRRAPSGRGYRGADHRAPPPVSRSGRSGRYQHPYGNRGRSDQRPPYS